MALKDNPVIFLAARTWKYSKKNRPNLVFYILLFLVAHFISFLGPLIIGKILNIIQEQGLAMDNYYTILGYLSLLILLTLGFWMFHGPARVIETKNAFIVRANYKKYLLNGVMSLPPEWHTDHHSGDTIDKVGKATEALFNFSRMSFEVIESITRFIGSYLALAYFNIHSSYIVIIIVIITIIIILTFDRTLVKNYKQLNIFENKISAKIYDVISNIMTVIILRVEKLVTKSIYKKIMSPFKLFVKNQKINEAKWFLVSTCTAIMSFSVLASYVYVAVKSGDAVMIGTIFILYGYVERINNLFFRFAWKYSEIVRQKTAVLNVKPITDEFRKRRGAKQINLNKNWNEINIRNLNFSYHTEEGQDRHLEDIDMIIKRKQKIALIGESGSGKTTLLKIIRDLYHTKNVEVYIDKRKLRKGFKSISSNITLIPQDPEIFTTTIRENITLGVSYKQFFVRRFVKMAQFANVVKKLPKKYESSIVEKGVNLSGGEKQRLALARGLIASADKSILLLDEATSSVDLKNEILIYHNIFTKFKSKTIISSIHKLHLLPMFDMIYFLKSGKIIASGTFKQLKKNSKEFKILWKKYNKELKKK